MTAEIKEVTEALRIQMKISALSLSIYLDEPETSNEQLRERIYREITAIKQASQELQKSQLDIVDPKILIAMQKKQQDKKSLEQTRDALSTVIAEGRVRDAVAATADIDKQYASVLALIPTISDISDPVERLHFQTVLFKKCQQLLNKQPSIPLKHFMAKQGLDVISALSEDPIKQKFKKIFNLFIQKSNEIILWSVAFSYKDKNPIANREMKTLSLPEQAVVLNDVTGYEDAVKKQLIPQAERAELLSEINRYESQKTLGKQSP